DLSPGTGVAGVGPRIVQPGVVPVLAGPGNGMEDPQPLACLDVEPTDVPLLVALAARYAAGQMRRPDDDGVSGDSRRGVQPNLASHEVHRLIVIQLEIDDATRAEARDRNAG